MFKWRANANDFNVMSWYTMSLVNINYIPEKILIPTLDCEAFQSNTLNCNSGTISTINSNLAVLNGIGLKMIQSGIVNADKSQEYPLNIVFNVPFDDIPSITTTVISDIDTETDRAKTATITSLSNTGFTIYSVVAVNDGHKSLENLPVSWM